MKVQNRLSLLTSLVFGIIFIVTSVFIYGLYSTNIKKSIYDKLQQTASITALFYLEEDELNKEEFAQVIRQFQERVTHSYYQVYNEQDTVRYGTAYLEIPSETLDAIRAEGKMAFAVKDFLCYGIYYEDNQGNFVIVTGEKKEVLTQQLTTLLWIIALAFIIGITAIIILSKWMAYVAYRPFRKVIRQVNNISTHNLHVQIKSPDTKDELQSLITTFNHLLVKISETFAIQQNFVRYVSHEFKTPLASMQGNLEVFAIKERTAAEYRDLSQNLLEQIRQLDEIVNTLTVISDSEKDPAENISPVRIDDIIAEVLQKLSARYSTALISFRIDIEPEEEKRLTVFKNRTPLFIALFNIIENAAKYTLDKKVDIRLFLQNGKICLSVGDTGIGIPPEQLEHISKPFYRADNARHIQGSGIGLSIALRILEKNSIEYKIDSVLDQGTTVLLFF